jgi:endonuclease G
LALLLLGVALSLVLLRGCVSRQQRAAEAPPRRIAPPSSPHVALGVPTDFDPSDDLILDERDFVLSYNERRLDPNWVAWQLDARYLGTTPRRDNFRPDDMLPVVATRVTPHDYLHSGYDRGHLCPSADRNATEEMNSLTFLMTNMVPQLHELNAGPWEKLEEHERRLADVPGAELYIVAGPLFDTDPRTIGRGVAVPRATYKVIAVLTTGQSANDVTPRTPVISVVIPNDAGVSGRPWTDFATSVDDVELQSGYDLLSAIPDDVEAAVESIRFRPSSVP